jgi:Flp pilus assembly pilin Flp
MLSRMRRDESGVAMVIVAFATFVTLALVTVAVQSAVSSRSLSRRDQDWNAALAAAEAGVDDYLSRLNRDDSYWLYSATTPPPDGNQAFTDWVPIPGPANEGDFRYDPDTSRLVSEGVVGLSSTGRVRSTTRTVQVTLRKRNFLDYLYFTEYETKDPAAYTGIGEFTPGEAQTLCSRHYYGTPPRDPRCTDIYFFSRDTLNGPVHSNDAILISGTPRFMGDTSTSWDDPSGRRWRGSGNPFFARAGDPELVAPLTLPPSNTAIRTEADTSLGGDGCVFTGPTSIILNATGTMDVDSPFTDASEPGKCSDGPGLSLPPNGVIYVENVPAGHGDANCGIDDPRPLGYPIANDITNYSCLDGDVFLEGTLNGRLTIAAEHDITVVWHVTYAGGLAGDDILGLVANNYVQVYHPVRCTSTDGDGNCTNGVNLQVRPSPNQFFRNPEIHAAILSVTHSFRVQNYRFGGDLGLLRVRGAIGQLYRGIVGTFSGNNPSSGYEKDYVYDQRLRYQSPPHFLDPVASSWQVATWAEEPPAYQA